MHYTCNIFKSYRLRFLQDNYQRFDQKILEGIFLDKCFPFVRITFLENDSLPGEDESQIR